MKKSRFYGVTVRDGHGETTHVVAGQKKSLIQNSFENDKEKVTRVEFLGFKNVSVRPNESYDDAEFKAYNSDGTELATVDRNSLGFDTLSNLLDTDYRECICKIKSWHEE
ncbi:hypothetical protein [Marinagarivorans cellulosilyticus]|uniref:Uncharacterized protein n=1 Tax=Marinagarivorans cellulosilyticus TaxID=2721545 RepID=A0AAN2BLQ9_9GAMM|nr:hypothetical protein [Marinagarivorans cellulosilyticus]BCD99393.1 hypothetical protein MARGE09_P3595 [Marinagarivorans cellulosilyticus]